MARLTIEDEWWTDPRRSVLMRLLGGEDEADLAAIRLWKLAQKYWGNGKKPIPLEMFNLLEAAPKLIEAKLAIVEGNDVYARGSHDYLSWLDKYRSNASKGGKKSAESRRRKNGSAQPNPKRLRSDFEANASDIEPSVSGSVFVSDSVSGSETGEHVNSSNSHTRVQKNAHAKTNAFITAYCERFKSRYGDNPEIIGKDAGIAARVVKSWGGEKIELYLDAFFSMPDAYLVKAKHPLSLFESKLNEIVVFAKSGKFTTRREMAHADVAATNMQTVEALRRGEI